MHNIDSTSDHDKGQGTRELDMTRESDTAPTKSEQQQPTAAKIKPARRVYTRDRSDRQRDTGRYQNGYRVYRDGSYREDFGSDR